MAAPPLPAPFSTAGAATLPTSPAAYVPVPPEHVAIDIPSAAAAAAFARLVVVKEGGAPPTPPPPKPERAAAVGTPAAGAGVKKNHPTTMERPDPFVRTLVKAMWVAYLLTLTPAALVGSAVVYGGDALLLVLGVFFTGVITGALFHDREDEAEEDHAEAKGWLSR